MLKAMMNMDRECAATAQALLEEKVNTLEKYKHASQAEILGLRYRCLAC